MARRNPAVCMLARYAPSNPHIDLVLSGPRKREQLKQNFTALGQGPLTPEELSWVREYGRMDKAGKKLDYV